MARTTQLQNVSRSARLPDGISAGETTTAPPCESLSATSTMSLSVIIPTLNEAPRIGAVIDSLRNLGQMEIVVVDGGSEDGTQTAAAAADVVLSCSRGRSVQQNTGAAAASGEVLLFLHADCTLTDGCLSAVRKVLADPACVGGCFQQRIDADGFKYRLMERGNGWRARWLKWAYGDQGIFVRRSVFEAVGGFPDLRLMEDLFFMKKLKRQGQFRVIEPRLIVSARRWQKQGYVRQTLRNWGLITLAHCGVSPDSLARFYCDVR